MLREQGPAALKAQLANATPFAEALFIRSFTADLAFIAPDKALRLKPEDQHKLNEANVECVDGPAHAVAISTQSSLASLPAMLKGAERLGVPVAASGVTLPLAVAIFRATGPAMNLAVVFYIAHWFGMHLTATQIAAGIAVAAMTEIGSVSLPGAISYISSVAPICIAMGVPIEPLVLFVAVDMLPDLVRTVGNVATDTAAAAVLARRSGYGPGEASTRSDERLKEDPATSV